MNDTSILPEVAVEQLKQLPRLAVVTRLVADKRFLPLVLVPPSEPFPLPPQRRQI